MTEREVQKEKHLDDGVHHGVIIDVEFREKPYAYADVVIELPDKFRIKAGYADFVSQSSKLGMLLARFGANLVEGSRIDIQQQLVGTDVEFMSTTSGKFANVVLESLKPLVVNTNNADGVHTEAVQ